MFNELNFQEWLSTRYRPFLGREDDDEDIDDEDTDDEDIVIEDEETPDDEEDIDDDDGDDVVTLRQQLAKAQADAKAAQAAARKAAAEGRKARQKAAADTGNWEAVAKEHEATIADLTEQLNETTGGKEATEYELDQFRREVRVTRLASRLGFRDPADASALLKDDQTGDDKTCERALRQLAEEKPYLRDPRKAAGIPGGNGGGRGGITAEQLKSMSPDEINALWDKGVQEALTRG